MHHRGTKLAGQVVTDQRQASHAEPMHPRLIAGYCVARGVDERDTCFAGSRGSLASARRRCGIEQITPAGNGTGG
jgi:hypothetical protein